MTSSDLQGDKASIASIGTSASVSSPTVHKPSIPSTSSSTTTSIINLPIQSILTKYEIEKGILYLSAPLTFSLLTLHPRLRPYFGPLGLLVSTTALILSSFSTSIWQLIATQGVLCALGSGLLYSPTTLYLDEWWVKRKGLAYGVMLGSKSAAGVALPFLTQILLEKYGFRITIRAWAVASVRSAFQIPPLNPEDDSPVFPKPTPPDPRNQKKIKTNKTPQLILTFPLLHFLRPRISLPPANSPGPSSPSPPSGPSKRETPSNPSATTSPARTSPPTPSAPCTCTPRPRPSRSPC